MRSPSNVDGTPVLGLAVVPHQRAISGEGTHVDSTVGERRLPPHGSQCRNWRAHETAGETGLMPSFDEVADDYDCGRPDHPGGIYDALGPIAGTVVLEGGAGTGMTALEDADRQQLMSALGAALRTRFVDGP